MIELSAIGKYKCIFFLVNAKEQNVDRCHRKSSGADDWPVIYGGARVYRCLHAVITPRESIVATGEYINTGTFSIAPP